MRFRKRFILKWLIPLQGDTKKAILQITVYIAKYDALYWIFSLS